MSMVSTETLADVTGDLCLVARTPDEMAAAQASLAEWFAQKKAIAERDADDLAQSVGIAVKANIKSDRLERQEKIARRRVEFYDKCRLAIEAGFCIVPNFPVDVFAIRTTKKNPRRDQSISQWDTHEQSTDSPAAGEGRNVSNLPVVYERNVEVFDAKTDEYKVQKHYFAKGFDEIEFPISISRPEVMSATQRALAEKVFDEIGCLPHGRQRGDPIVVGRIRDPRWGERMVSFLIAWWIDTREL